MSIRPTGTVTFLFTDIEGSTRLAQEFPDTLQSALYRHNSILQNVIESNRGFVFEIIGDAFCCAFGNANDAVKAAIEIQLALAREKWEDAAIKIRIGIHSGKADWSGTKYSGYITLARTARVMSATYGEQILISKDTYNLLDQMLSLKEPETKRINNDNSGTVSLNGKTEISFRDLGERKLKDLMQPLRLYQVAAAGLRYDFPPLKSLDPRRNNLPVQLTSFIGREVEIKNAKELLKHTKLLTITGTGGSGKTRLALKIAADVIDEYECGVWFVEFESLTEDSHPANSVTKVLGIMEQPNTTVEDQLTDYIKDREMLIIFDNCEHVINAAAILAFNLLTKCPKLKIIATSREALRCEGEKIYQLYSLKYPDPDKIISPEKLKQYESVRLFIERASSADPGFSVNEENANAIARICYQLEGIPLAIELAAARIKTLSAEQIHKRLDDIFSLLTTGYRTALPRQQTLRALINWSYELLTDKEKTLWNRLSVFSGGWTPEAAEDICTDEKIRRSDISELLEALAEKSIIILNKEKTRYRMLESIKQFGAQKLKEEEDDPESISDRHFIYYTELATAEDEKLKGDKIVHGLKNLDTENSNIVKALEQSIKSYRFSEAAKLALEMRTYWEVRGLTSEALDRFETIRSMFADYKSDTNDKITLYYRVNTSAGIFYRLKSNFGKAEELFQQSFQYYREINNKAGEAESLRNLGLNEYDKGEYLKASEYYNASLKINNAMGNKKEIADIHFYLGNLSFYQGDYSTAFEFHQKSLGFWHETGNMKGITLCHNGLGLIALAQGDYSTASRHFEESLSINREIGFKHLTAVILNNLGSIEHERGNYLKAYEYFDESLSKRRETGDKRGIALLLCNLASMSFELGNDDKALEFYEESLAISREIGDKSVLILSLNNMGFLFYEKGDFLKAAEFFEEGLKTGKEIGEKPAISHSQLGLGDISLVYGNYMEALEYYESSLDISREIGDKSVKSISLKSIANLNFAEGKYSKALEFYEQSLMIDRELGDKTRIASSLTGLSSVFLVKGELEKALSFLDESDANITEPGHKKQTSLNHYYRGLIYIRKEKYEDAQKHLTESLILRKELGNVIECALSILSLAMLRIVYMDHGQGLKLLSFVKNYFESNKLALYKSEQESLYKYISELKSKMNAEDYSGYLEYGKSITPEEAIELAINSDREK